MNINEAKLVSKASGITIQEIAKMLQINHATVSRTMNGKIKKRQQEVITAVMQIYAERQKQIKKIKR